MNKFKEILIFKNNILSLNNYKINCENDYIINNTKIINFLKFATYINKSN